ncbi:unnamed protein product, partial [Symbiodinium microadriaticum]
MPLHLEVALLSGKRARLDAEPEWSLDHLRKRARNLLGSGPGKLLSPAGAILRGTDSLAAAGLQEADVLTFQKGPVQIAATSKAFAALYGDGSVVTWGHKHFGGDSSGVAQQLQDVQQIQAAQEAFAALCCDGSVVTWGGQGGGDSAAVKSQLKDVTSIQAAGHAFAALRRDGSVVSWGAPKHGGDCSAVQGRLSDVQQIQ